MFRGISALILDNKGRIAIPTRYRERLYERSQGRLVFTVDTEDPCLLLYPLDEWEQIERKLQDLPRYNTHARRIQRLLIGHAEDVEMDSNGRVLIPQALRKHLDVEADKHITLVGQGRKFELWREQLWESGRQAWLATSGEEDKSLSDELRNLVL